MLSPSRAGQGLQAALLKIIHPGHMTLQQGRRGKRSLVSYHRLVCPSSLYESAGGTDTCRTYTQAAEHVGWDAFGSPAATLASDAIAAGLRKAMAYNYCWRQ